MIEVNNLTTNLVDEEFLKKVAEKVLEGESASWRNKKTELSIAVVGQGRIRELIKNTVKKTEQLMFWLFCTMIRDSPRSTQGEAGR